MKKEVIRCEHCGKNIADPGFSCDAKICPLDHFTVVDKIPANIPAKTVRNLHNKKSTAGGPAPSDKPVRIRQTGK